MVKYRYNAWGTATQVITQGCEELDVLYNPFKFKGYFYDGETGFYYLKTRYYAPIIGKFISMDSINYMDIKSLNGVNLYAYCNNNPIMYADPNGHIPVWAILFALLCTPIGGIALQLAVSTVAYAGMLVASLFDDDIKQDLKNIKYNPFNSNADLIINDQSQGDIYAEKVSFYKGVPVFKINMGRGSCSVGAIFFDTNVGYSTQLDHVLKHERGHNTQFMMMGPLKYALFVCIPSPLLNGEGTPWEYTASVFGGSNYASFSTITATEKANAWSYINRAVSINPLLWLTCILEYLSMI